MFQNNFGKNKHLVHTNGGIVTFNKCKFVDNESPGTSLLYADLMGTGGTITLNECIVHGNKAWSMATSGMLSDINVHRTCFANNAITGITVVVVDNFGHQSIRLTFLSYGRFRLIFLSPRWPTAAAFEPGNWLQSSCPWR